MVDAICTELGVPDATRFEALKVAGLQDLGLLGVNATTLAADRVLCAEEKSELRRAPLVAQSLVASMPGYEKVSLAVRHVNERWDGKGYPDGLAGEEIPLASRIVAVAGAYLAMSSPRPFRAAMHPRTICNELEAGAGLQFDPAVVNALLTFVRPLLGTA